MPHEIFICHSYLDQKAARAICAGLEAAGLRCWIAPRDITAGVSWAATITEGIETSKVALILLSSSSNASAQVHHEVHLADCKGLHLLPLRLRNLKPSPALEYYVGDQHWFDAFPAPVEKHIPRLIEHIKKLLNTPLRRPSGTPDCKPCTPAPAPAPVSGKPTVLVVDDDGDLRLKIKMELAKDGYAIIMAEDGSKALAKVRESAKPPDIVILDMQMPVMDGLGFLEHFRADKRTAGIPVIVFTSMSPAGWKTASSTLGANAFLSKPFIGNELRALVRGLLQADHI